MNDTFIPRITVPDSEDRATVIAALTHYSHLVTHQASQEGDVVRMVDEMRIVVGVMEELVQQCRIDAVQTHALTDDGLAEVMEQFTQEITGDEPEH